MSYSKNILENYGKAIEDKELRTEFMNKIEIIGFFKEGNREICLAEQLKVALTGSKVEHLINDIRQNYVNFITEQDIANR